MRASFSVFKQSCSKKMFDFTKRCNGVKLSRHLTSLSRLIKYTYSVNKLNEIDYELEANLFRFGRARSDKISGGNFSRPSVEARIHFGRFLCHSFFGDNHRRTADIRSVARLRRPAYSSLRCPFRKENFRHIHR